MRQILKIPLCILAAAILIFGFTSTVFTATCGNGIVETGEFCDDGAQNGTPGMCFLDCQKLTPLCGNGIKEYPEECDDGNVDWGVSNCAIDCSVE